MGYLPRLADFPLAFIASLGPIRLHLLSGSTANAPILHSGLVQRECYILKQDSNENLSKFHQWHNTYCQTACVSVLVIAQDSLHDEIGDEHRNLPYYRPTLLAKYSELVDLGNVNIEWQEALS